MGDSKVVLPTEIMSHGIVVSVCPVCESPWDENDTSTTRSSTEPHSTSTRSQRAGPR